MPSALTNAALAVPGVVGYYPMEETTGATQATDASTNALSALTLQGVGASTHITPGAVSPVPGAAGAWACDGTTGVYMSRAVGAGDAMQLSTWTVAGWLYPTAIPSGSIKALGRDNNWEVRLSTSVVGSAWNSAVNYQPGQSVNLSGASYVALQSNTNVTPGTNGTVWEQIVQGTSFGWFTTLGAVSFNTLDPIPFSKPSFVAVTFDGYEYVCWLNSVRQQTRYAQTNAGAWDTVTQTTDPFVVFGLSGAALTGSMWGVGVWNNALDRGALRSIYLAGIGAGNEVTPTFGLIDTVRDQATPQITSSGAVAYYCAGCAGGMRAAEGYITVSSKRYHHGCYAARRSAITPSALGNSSTFSDLADRVARNGYGNVLSACRREHVEKWFHHDGTYFIPYQHPTYAGNTADWRSWAQTFGSFTAVLARFSRADRESWLVALAANQMEFLISAMIGAPSSWLAAGRTSIAQTPVTGAGGFGCIQPAFDTSSQGAEQSWVLRAMCLIYLCLKRQMPAATLNRWEQAIAAAANYLVSGRGPTAVANPTPPNQGPTVPTNQYWYVNANFMVRYPVDFYLVYLVTGDRFWRDQHDIALNYALYPYGTGLHWQGVWAAPNTYGTSDPSGPDAVRYSGDVYQCVSAIAGSAGNQPPNIDTAHWTKLETGNPVNRQGYGLIVETVGADATYWSDYIIHINEYGSGAGGGPPGSPLAGQPGYDGDYNATQTDELTLGYFVTGLPTYRQLANALMNKSGLYPAGGGVGNPQASWFNFAGVFVAPGTYGGSGNQWVIDKTSGQSGGYSTRHSLNDGYRCPWLPISQLAGYRSDLTAGFGVAQFVTQVEQQLKQGIQWTNYGPGNADAMMMGPGLLLMGAPGWPGL